MPSIFLIPGVREAFDKMPERQQIGLIVRILILAAALGIILFLLPVAGLAQTSTDLFVMPGSDFVRPGLYPRANLNIGIGHSMNRLTKIRVGDELTFGYTYENGGPSGFWHSQNGAHTEALGLMKNLPIGMRYTVYLWEQGGLTSLTGGPKGVQNRMFVGHAIGLAYHFTIHSGVWLQEQVNFISTVPRYSTTSIGYVVSW